MVVSGHWHQPRIEECGGTILVKPGNDLSRGYTAEDIVNTVILTVLQTVL